MKDNEYTINVVEQKEHYSSLGRSNYNDSKKKNNIRKISMELKNLESQENEQKNSPEKKEFFPKITNQYQKTNNNINNTKKIIILIIISIISIIIKIQLIIILKIMQILIKIIIKIIISIII